ncbi:MAG: hypothetical protein LBI26_02080 [Holosporales bacterium]|nr:hypothetical protein [Holosporales bacterium]
MKNFEKFFAMFFSFCLINGISAMEQDKKEDKYAKRVQAVFDSLPVSEAFEPCMQHINTMNYGDAATLFKVALFFFEKCDCSCLFLNEIVHYLITNGCVNFKLSDFYDEQGVSKNARDQLLSVEDNALVQVFSSYRASFPRPYCKDIASVGTGTLIDQNLLDLMQEVKEKSLEELCILCAHYLRIYNYGYASVLLEGIISRLDDKSSVLIPEEQTEVFYPLFFDKRPTSPTFKKEDLKEFDGAKENIVREIMFKRYPIILQKD